MTTLVDDAARAPSAATTATPAPTADPEPPRWKGSHSIDTILGDGSGLTASWSVEVYPTSSEAGIERCVSLKRHADPEGGWLPWEPAGRWRPERVIWPAWTVQPDGGAAAGGSALDSVHESWRNSSDRIRDSAKWMATVIGLALAAIVGTSPLAVLSDRSGPMGWALALAVIGLVLLASTMVLVLRVLRPGDTSYVDVQTAKLPSDDEQPLEESGRSAKGPPGWLPGDPLSKWRYSVETQQDLWLPCGVKCLTTLRQAMIVDELTLMALSCAATDDHVTAADIESLRQAQTVRVARLREFKQAAARIVEIGEFYRLRRRSDWATYLGGAMSAAGTMMIILAFVVLS